MNVLIMRRLQDHARSEASFANNGLTDLERELSDFATYGEDLTRRIEVARNAPRRAQAYRPRTNDNYQCPCCAVYTEAPMALKEVNAETGHRHFVCDYCGNEYDFDMTPVS